MSDVDGLRQQFADDRHLRVRQEIHEQYSIPNVDFAAWVLERGALGGGKKVLDVGIGGGSYYRAIREHYPETDYVATDFSFGILARHEAASSRVVCDAQQLPFPDGTFDIVMPNHMLFRVPDIEEAIFEFKRLLKPDGLLLTATNSIQTMPEFQALFRRALLLLSNHVRPNSPYLMPPHEAFTLENGVRRLAHHFFAVVRHDLPSALVFPETEPVMAYLDSLRSLREDMLPPDITWDALMEAMFDQVNRVITLQGELVINKLSGVLVASDAGGFISQYHTILHKPPTKKGRK
ncbi:MAG: class I SAM-dependent methyltransferase [Anaerolineae bacterium]|nr:class I SAM-dependent methyltransferase [Anaerolineae bacterium]